MLTLPLLQDRDPIGRWGQKIVALQLATEHFCGLEEGGFVDLLQPIWILKSSDPSVDQGTGVAGEKGRKLTIAVIGKVTAGFVEFDAAQVRTVDRFVTPFEHFFAQEIFEQTANVRPLEATNTCLGQRQR